MQKKSTFMQFIPIHPTFQLRGGHFTTVLKPGTNTIVPRRPLLDQALQRYNSPAD